MALRKVPNSHVGTFGKLYLVSETPENTSNAIPSSHALSCLEADVLGASASREEATGVYSEVVPQRVAGGHPRMKPRYWSTT